MVMIALPVMLKVHVLMMVPMMVVQKAVLMVSSIVGMVIVFLDHGNVTYTGVIVPIVPMKLIVVDVLQ